MRKRSRKLVSALIVCAGTGHVPAEATDAFVIIGPGSVECGQMLEIKKSFEDAGNGDEFQSALAAYAQGFWSGLNFQRERSGAKGEMRALDMGRDTITRELLDRCASDPSAPLFTQLWILFEGFKGADAPD